MFPSGHYYWASGHNNYNPSNPFLALGGLSDGTTQNAPVADPTNTTGDTASITTCYDFKTAAAFPIVYSMGGTVSPNNASMPNCTLSFIFQ
jgi:hypothetical protein